MAEKAKTLDAPDSDSPASAKAFSPPSAESKGESVKRSIDPTTAMPGFTSKRSMMPEKEYRRGGKVGKGGAGGMTVHNYCAGGKVISSKNH